MGVLSGLWVAITQITLWEQYIANNPWHSEAIAAMGDSIAAQILGFALGMGLLWGLLMGGLTVLLRRIWSKNSVEG